MAVPQYVPAKRVQTGWRDLTTGQVTKVRRPGSSAVPVYGMQKGHYASAGGGWVPKPGTKVGTGKIGIPDRPGGEDGLTSGYLSWEEMQRRAALLADQQMGVKTAAIERARAAAMTQARRDAATYSALGNAQMGMIGQIPANIQGIRNTAAAAMASTAGQIAGAQQQQGQAEQAAGAAFTASQTGGTAAGPTEVNPTAAAAAVEALGGTIPAQSEVEIGGASAIAASGMPAVVARATQDQVAMRMAQAASEDADYRQQLIDAAGERGGIYQDALDSIFGLEEKKFGLEDALQKRKDDAAALEYKRQQDVLDRAQWREEMTFKKRTELANEVALKIKTKAQAAKELRNYSLAVRRAEIAQQNANTSQTRADTSAGGKQYANDPNYYTDASGRTVPKGYRYNAAGELISIGTPKAPTKGPKSFTASQKAAAVQSATGKAFSIARTNSKPHYDTRPGADPSQKRPTKARQSTRREIIAEITPKLQAMGYGAGFIAAIADKAIKQIYP